MFSCNGNKGFHLTFDNGYTLSTQFGYGNYCENYRKENNRACTRSKDSEIAVFYPDGDMMYLDSMIKELFNEEVSDVVCGSVTIEKWFKICEYVKNIKAD